MAGSGRLLSAVLLAAAVLAGAAAMRVHADNRTLAAGPEDTQAGPGEGNTPAVRRSLSLDQAVRLVEQRYRGRVVRADTERDEGRTLYVMRVLDDGGHVWSVRVDADSGAVL